MASNWRETAVVGCCLVLAQVYLFSPVVVEGQYAAQIGCLNVTCKAKLNALLERYEYAVDSVNGCDVECQYNCYELLEEALESTTGTHCPPVDNVTACFGLYGNEWVELAEECPVFNIKEQSEAEAEGESEDAEAPASSEEAEAEEAEAEAEEEAEAPSPSASAEAENDNATGTTSRRLMEEEASEAEAAGDEAESEAEAAGDEAEAEAEAAGDEAEAEAEAAGDEAEAEAEGECSSSSGGEGEAEGEADFVGKGCFPEFETLTDFKVYTEGAYYAAVWDQPTNTVGIILSVFFWLGLAGMGVYLGRK